MESHGQSSTLVAAQPLETSVLTLVLPGPIMIRMASVTDLKTPITLQTEILLLTGTLPVRRMLGLQRSMPHVQPLINQSNTTFASTISLLAPGVRLMALSFVQN